MTSSERSQQGPIFIVGMQRSGTTLLRSLLSAHPHVAIAPETHFLNEFRRSAGVDELATRSDFKRFWNTFVSSARFQDLRLDTQVLESRITESGEFHFRDVFRVVMEEYARQAHKPRWGEKTPHHREYIGDLLGWFPTARVVFMLRDPRAVCASMGAVPWRSFPGSGLRRLAPRKLVRLRRILHDAVAWQDSLDQFRRDWASDAGVTVVRYEDLLVDPERSLRVLCNFLGEEYSDLMIERRTSAAVPPPATAGYSAEHASWRRVHVEMSLQPLQNDSISKWEQLLSGTEVRAIEGSCCSGMTKYGYSLRSSTLSCTLFRPLAKLIQRLE